MPTYKGSFSFAGDLEVEFYAENAEDATAIAAELVLLGMSSLDYPEYTITDIWLTEALSIKPYDDA